MSTLIVSEMAPLGDANYIEVGLVYICVRQEATEVLDIYPNYI